MSDDDVDDDGIPSGNGGDDEPCLTDDDIDDDGTPSVDDGDDDLGSWDGFAARMGTGWFKSFVRLIVNA